MGLPPTYLTECELVWLLHAIYGSGDVTVIFEKYAPALICKRVFKISLCLFVARLSRYSIH